MSHSPVGGVPFHSLGGGLLSYEDTGHGGGMPHIQDLSSPSEGHLIQGDSDSEYNDDYAQQLDDAAANDESDEENSDGGDAQLAESEEEEDEAENEEASEPDSENDDDGGDEDDEDASDPQQAEQAGMGAGANNFRRARSAMNRRGRVTQRSETSADQEDDDDDLSYAMRLQRQINNTSGNRRRSTRAAAQKRPVYADSMDDASENEDDSEDGVETMQRADREVNGSRSRPSRRAASAALEAMQQKPKVARKGKKKVAGRAVRGATEPRKPSRSTRTSNHAIQRPKYAESSEESSDSASETEKQEKREALQKEMVSGPCKANGYYISPYPEDLDDEVERVLGHRDMEDIELDPVNPWTTREFHIKWKRYAYIHSSWDTLATLQQLPGIKRVQNYMRRVDELAKQTSYLSPEELELINVERQMQEQLVEDHMMVERIIEEFVEGDETKYLVKWGGLPYMENTWELKEAVLQAQNGEQAIDEYQERESRVLETSKTVEGQRKSFLMKGHRALTVQPKFLAGGELRDYQLNGLNWLVYSWLQDNNVILADEMGLGKTIQCVSFCAYLAQTLSIMGPFLVIVPLSTVHNWVKEFAKWAPQVNTVVYVGDTVSRGVARRYEFETNRRTGRQHRFEVMITTFEVVLKDAPILNKIKWNFMLMDEAHRLKNHESALYQELMTWHFKNKLLVTGTPLQNSIQELWALLHFLEPQKFDSMEGFIEAHSLDTDEGVRSLHAELSPHLLRRVIKDVEKSLPPKNERILRVEMTPLQKQYYKWILNRNFEALNKGARGSGHVSLLNIITELKKTCNHPFLFESAEESYRGRDDENAVDRLVTTSGKMVILDKLMQRLKATGHRVLIFSQMVRVLDIISDYLRLRGYCHQRLDGSTSPIARQQAMSHFNAEGSPDFAFLLSTRAGGLGINLATADTVIIFDSDWNPQNDLQAMSRAHRIGQKDTVNIYRFVTSGSVEENILERAKQKMVLDHVVIQRMDTSGRMVLDPRSSNQSAKMFDKEELSAILRFGAEKLFKTGGGAGEEESTAQEEEEEEAQALYEESIDDILARAEKVETSTTAAAEGGANELLNQFNYATFKNEEDDATFWSRLIPVEKRIEEKEEELLPRQARLKVERGDLAEDEPESPKSKRRERREGRGPVKSKAMQAGPPLENCHRRVEEVVAKGEEEATTVSLNKKEALAFVRAVRKFGTTERMEDIVAESGPHVAEELDSAVHTALYNALLDGCRDAVKVAEEVRAREAKEEPPPTGEGSKPEKKVDPQLDFFGVCVKAADLVTIVEKLDMMHKKLRLYSERPGQYRLETASQLSAPKWGSHLGWTPRDDAMLLMGVHRHGLGNWEKVINDPVLGLEEKLGAKRAEEAGDSGKLPKGSHLETRALGLLKKMEALMRKPPKAPAARPDKATRRPIHSKAAARLKRESSVSESDLKGSAARRPPGAGRPKAKPSGNGRGGKVVDPQQALDEVRVTMKKLRTLQRHKDIPKDQAIAKTRKYLKEVGKHIDDVTGGHSQEKLWNWVAKFTENPLSGERLMNIYRRLAGLDAPAGGSRGGGSGEDRRERSSEPVGTSHRPGDAINKRAAVGDGGRGGEAAHHNHHHQQHKRQRMERTHSAETSEIAHAEWHRGREHDRDRQRDDRQQADRGRSRNFDNGLQREGSMATGASGTLQGSGSGTISRRAPVR